MVPKLQDCVCIAQVVRAGTISNLPPGLGIHAFSFMMHIKCGNRRSDLASPICPAQPLEVVYMTAHFPTTRHHVMVPTTCSAPDSLTSTLERPVKLDTSGPVIV